MLAALLIFQLLLEQKIQNIVYYLLTEIDYSSYFEMTIILPFLAGTMCSHVYLNGLDLLGEGVVFIGASEFCQLLNYLQLQR